MIKPKSPARTKSYGLYGLILRLLFQGCLDNRQAHNQ